MQKCYYNKLVRDGIKQRIADKGEAASVRVISDDDEFIQELLKKIREEADGLAKARTRQAFLDEYADLMVVLDALTAVLEISEAELAVAMTENIGKKGYYKERHFLEWSEDRSYVSNETPQGLSK